MLVEDESLLDVDDILNFIFEIDDVFEIVTWFFRHWWSLQIIVLGTDTFVLNVIWYRLLMYRRYRKFIINNFLSDGCKNL